MFCNQCEQTAKGKGCTVRGVCGKSPRVAALQDLLVHSLKGLALYVRAGRDVGVSAKEADVFTAEALFATLTNVNFDEERFFGFIQESVALTRSLEGKVLKAGGSRISHPAVSFSPADNLDDLVRQAQETGSPWTREGPDDIRSLQQVVLFGLKGVAAYTHHAAVLGHEDEKIYAFLYHALTALAEDNLPLESWVEMALKCGEANLLAMELLDKGNTETFGHPVPTPVPLGHKEGKGILVSGHDLKDLKNILEQTRGRGITVYTHGEMLPAHGYPELKKYEHLYGNYGTAWQNQKKEFARFPGAIVMTTNCIQEPKEAYRDNIFTTAMTGYPGAVHLEGNDFSPVIEKALALPGFPDTRDKGEVTVGFARNAVLGAAEKIIAGIKQGDIRRFFLVAGCDGAKPGRNYYTEFVEKAPEDTVILTLACGKYRFYDKKLGDIGGIPRLLDMGQCNDAYSAIQVSAALAEAFDCDINELPLSLILSWYEQKAVAILLTLLHLGMKNIRLGPSLPAFITPNVLEVLVKNFNIMPISTPEEDLKAILQA